MGVRYEPGDPARVVVVGELDDGAADALVTILRRVAEDAPARLELDLRRVTGFTPAGASAVSEALALGRMLEDGVGVTVATDAGRRALLRSMAYV